MKSETITAWNEMSNEASKHKLSCTVLSFFNANVDMVVHLDAGQLANLLRDPAVTQRSVDAVSVDKLTAVATKSEFVALLRDRMRTGQAVRIVLKDWGMLSWFATVFRRHTKRLGGSAGIVANQMAFFDTKSILYSPALTDELAKLFAKDVEVPELVPASPMPPASSSTCNTLSLSPIQQASYPSNLQTKTNWVFEYEAVPYDFWDEIICPARANRVIIATLPPQVKMEFASAFTPAHLATLGSQADCVFAAGYQSCDGLDEDRRNAYIQEAVQSLRNLKANNPTLRIHIEYVAMKNPAAVRPLLRSLGGEAHSLGLNEVELQDVLRYFGYHNESQEIGNTGSPYAIFCGLKKLKQELGFTRLHAHNLGYYVVVLDKEYPVAPQRVRQACLFATNANAVKAQHGGFVTPVQMSKYTPVCDLMTPDVQQCFQDLENDLGTNGFPVPPDFLDQGMYEDQDCRAVFVPSFVVPNPQSTVGFGDTVSSLSFAGEL